MPGLGRELLHRVHERHSAMVGQEADRIAVRAAAEAMVEALVVVDGEARRLLVVERAAGLPLAPGADQLHRWRDHAPTTACARAIRRARRWRGSHFPSRVAGGVRGGPVPQCQRDHLQHTLDVFEVLHYSRSAAPNIRDSSRNLVLRSSSIVRTACWPPSSSIISRGVRGDEIANERADRDLAIEASCWSWRLRRCLQSERSASVAEFRRSRERK